MVTHRPADVLVKGPTTFTFVTAGVARAVELAQEVVVNGGAAVVQQAFAAGLVDELRLHVVPVLLGHGTRLFEQPLGERMELEPLDSEVTPLATHVTYRVEKGVP